MTATQGSVSSASAAYLSAEEPELSSINFRQSLRFFQEQLVSSKGFRQASSTFCINFQDEPSKAKETSRSSSRISIPTVDTILESVRVLRAIQKSQQQRGSTWSLDLVKTDDDPLEAQHSSVFKDLEIITNGDLYSGLLTISTDDKTRDHEKNESTSSMDRVEADDDRQHSYVVMDSTRITNGVLHSGLLTTSETSMSDIDKSKENRASETECTSTNQMTTFWPSNTVEQEVTDVISEKNVNLTDMQSDVQFENNSSDVASKRINGVNNGSVSLEDLQVVTGNIVNNQEHSVTSKSNDSGKEQVVENNSFLNSFTVTEKSHAEDFHTNLQDEDQQNKELYIETNLVHLDEDSEYFYITENHTVKRKILDSEGIPISCGQLRPESRSDTCSSIYVSAEGSPCASLYSELDLTTQVQEKIQAYSSQCTSNESKKDINFDAWTTDSSGIGTDLTNDSRTNESTSSRSSTPIDNNILDDCLVTDKQTKEECISQTSCKDIKHTEKNISTLEENANPITTFEDSYSNCTEGNIRPSPSIEVISVSIDSENPNNETNDNKPEETSNNETNDNKLYGTSNNETNDNKPEETSNNETNDNKPEETSNNETSDHKLYETSNNETNDNKPEETSNNETNDNKPEETSNKIEINACDSNADESSTSKTIDKVPDINKVLSNKIVDESEVHGIKKFTTSSWNLEAITESLYAIAEPKSLEVSSSTKLVSMNEGLSLESPGVRITPESSSVDCPSNTLGISDNGSGIRPGSCLQADEGSTKEGTKAVILEEYATFQTTVFVMNEGIFAQYSPGNYVLELQEHTLQIKQETKTLISVPLTYAEVSILHENVLKVDNRLGKCLYFKIDAQKELTELLQQLKFHCLKGWESETLHLVHYPMKCHQNVVIVDLGSCSTRAGILMDQPTLPFLFFPSICATDRKTGNHVYGKEALQLKVRQNSNLSFPLRPSVKIIKHSIDIDLIGGLFKKIFQELRVDPVQYVVQVCLPRSLSISAQNALVKLLLEDVKVQSVSLTHQALLTLYAHKASTGIVVDIGDRMDILPVVDGFIVDSGVTRLTYGGQRLIHHMKHALAEKHISLSNDIDSFVVQFIAENLSYVAENYDSEVQIASKFPDMVKKTVALDTFAKDDKCAQSATLDDARFKTPEGLFKPELWGLDSPGIHKLVHKAIHATGVDVRKKIAEHIYVSGGVTLIPGFVERLIKEVSDLNKPRIVPKVIASNYRYHCTYIGACEFAKMDVFPKVCVNIEEYSKNQMASLKKFVLCF